MTSKTQTRLFTLVQHSGFGVAGNPQFEHAVEEACLGTRREIDRVLKAGGVLFDSYLEACERVEQENYPAQVAGLIPRAPGSFAMTTIGGLRVYVPKAPDEVKQLASNPAVLPRVKTHKRHQARPVQR